MIVMENASTGVKREVVSSIHRLWCFLFGWLYYAVQGAWGPAVISFFTLNGLIRLPAD